MKAHKEAGDEGQYGGIRVKVPTLNRDVSEPGDTRRLPPIKSSLSTVRIRNDDYRA